MSRVVWVSPSPLWDDLLPLGTDRFRAPTLLRFASDDFMDEFQGVLSARPDRLRDYAARPETWRRPAAGLDTPPGSTNGGSPSTDGPPLKLFQPIHGRFYLLTASLACRVPGLPEHTVDIAGGDTVSFVIRRLTAAGELAWGTAQDGIEGWMPAEPRAVAPGEETLPMFPTNFAADDLSRRVFAGLVPVGRREGYVGGREVPAGGGGASGPTGPGTGAGGAPDVESVGGSASTANPLDAPAVLEFQRAVLDPWVALRDWYLDEVEQERTTEANVACEQSSALILLDFATYLAEELPGVWQVIDNVAPVSTLPPAQRAVYDALDITLWTGSGLTGVSFYQAMRTARSRAADIEGLSLPVDATPPSTPPGVTPVLLIGDPHPSPATLPPGREAAIAVTEARIAALLARESAASGAPEEAPGLRVRRLKHLIMNALATVSGSTGAGGPDGAANGTAGRRRRLPMLPPLNAQGDDFYVLRCVYARPRCGKGFPVLVSDASEPFQLASFFDPDAPQRPVRVALPIDTSPAGLRKFDKNVGFMLSNELRKQMSRVKGMKELLDGDIRNPRGLDLSVLCSFSIPIITLCALILLMIIVALLNFVFFWIPFVIQCIPIPSLKAKD